MSIEIRETTSEELRSAVDVVVTALMMAPPDDAAWERGRPSWEEMPSYTAWDGDRCIGHVGHFIVDTMVPGGARLPTGAVSRVGVLPTHRRRGVASRLMRELIHDADRRGFALMSLRASESTIYERFGFGLAGEFVAAELLPDRAAPVRGAATHGSFRLLARDEILDVLPAIYDRAAFTRPGAITRPASFFTRLFGSAIEGEKAAFVAVHTSDDGIDDGYVHYETAWDDDHPDGPTGKGQVHDLFGMTPAVELALWQFVCDVDLVTRWKALDRPLDDTVRSACRDVRAYRVRSIDDEQWVRLVDVGASLTARTYNDASGAVSISVTDALLPRNDGTWTVTAAGAVRDDARAPDLVTDVAGLSAAYLGGTSWYTLVATGRVEECAPRSTARADELFASRPLPFCGTFF